MSWTDLFKKSRLKTDPRIRWFGKLPTYPDYYSSPADEDWVVEFNDFVLKGFEIYQQRSGQSQGQLPRLPVSGCFLCDAIGFRGGYARASIPDVLLRGHTQFGLAGIYKRSYARGVTRDSRPGRLAA